MFFMPYCLGEQVTGNEIGQECNVHGRGEKCTHHFGGKPEGKRPLDSPEHRQEDVEWIHLALDVAL